MRRKRSRARLLATLLAGALLGMAGPTLPAVAAGGPSLTTGRASKASSADGEHPASVVNDGDQNTYWRSRSHGGKPSWVQTDLGRTRRIDRVVLRLPAGWQAHKETLALQGSVDGTSFNTLRSSATYAFTPGAGNTVTVPVPSVNARYVRVTFSHNDRSGQAQLAELDAYSAADSTTNLAAGRTATASSFTDVYPAPNATDGNAATYWESRNGAFPQWLQVDLGTAVAVNRFTLRLPSSWEPRSQTLKVQGSTDGTTFTDLVASASYDWNSANGNAVTLSTDTATTRYVRVAFTANSVQNGGQLSELEVYGPDTADTQAPTAPTDLAYTEPGSGQIKLTWKAATDNKGVTGYDVYADNTLRSSVAGNVTTFTDTQPANATVTYYVKARDAAGNQSANSNSVTRKGASGDTQAPTAPGNLSCTEPGSGQIKLTWDAATDNKGVTGYDVYADNTLRGSVGGSTTTYTDTQSASATVTYYVKARDAAGNQSAPSNSVTRTGSGTADSDMAVGKPVTESGHTYVYAPENAVDNDVSTYWEASGNPGTLTVELGANADTSKVVLKLNPDAAWSKRTQNIQILGREQSASGYTSLVAAKDYVFDPASGNAVTIPVGARVADVQVKIASNSGAPGGQIAELQVFGSPAPNPDLTVTSVTASPASPVETDAVTLSAKITNAGSASAPASTVDFLLAGEKTASASVPTLAAGASTTVNASVGTLTAGSYQVGATVDPDHKVVEQNDSNNTASAAAPLVVKPVASSDLVASPVSWSPTNPAVGKAVTFQVALKNQGTVASASGSHAVTLTLSNESGDVVKTFSGSYSGVIAAGATTSAVDLGSWTATGGKYTVKTVIADDADELPVKRANNTSTLPFFVGRGANMPYEMYEAEDGRLGGGAQVVGPNRTVGDLAGEASGRKAVTLDAAGSYVEFTTKAPTNTLVTRFSIPDSAGGGGTDATLNVYVNGQYLKAVNLTSKYAWLYGNETAPGNSPSAGGPRHIYDEANLMLGTTVPKGATIRLQKDAANTSRYAIDFVNTEQATQIDNPDPAAYVVPAGFTHQDVQNALDRVRMDTTGKLVGVYLPAGDYETSSKFQVYGKAVKVVGAGPWFTRFHAPSTQENTDVGFRADSTAQGSSFSGFAYFGNYTSRIDGPGKVFDFSNLSHITIDNIWVEHMVCLYWGANTDSVTIKNSRIRDTFADGVNMTNGSTDNLVQNNEARATGDDSFALFSAIDAGGADEKDNVYENLTSLLTWRAAGIAVYGGYDNTFRNLYVADTLVYSGVTISSLDFGYAMNGFGTDPTTIENASLVRTGGHFWGSQTFPAIWCFSASKPFQGIRVNDVDIVDPTYHGVMFQTNYVGGAPQNPVKDTVFTDISITGAKKSGDAYDARSGFGIWANEMPESGQGPAVGSATFHHVTFSGNAKDVQNTTSTFQLTINP